MSVPGWGVYVQGVSVKGISVRLGIEKGLCPEGDPLPHVNRMTDASKNITLPKTSLAGCNKAKDVGLCLSVRHGCRYFPKVGG